MAGAAGYFTQLKDQPRVVAHQLSWDASKPLSVVLGLLTIAGASVAPLYAITTGGLIAAAARHESVLGWLVAIGALYAAGQVLGPTREAVCRVLTTLIDDHVRHRMMAAMLDPNGIAHLEDPALQNKLELARGIAWGITPGNTLNGLMQLWLARLSALGSLLLVARFRLWLAAILLVANLLTLRSKKKSFLNMTQMYSRGTERLRKSAYFREVALGRDAAKESRVFGLGPWAVDHFDRSWFAAMKDVWDERKRGSLIVGLGLTLKGAATLMAFVYVVGSAFDAQTSLRELTVVVQALVGVASLSMVLGNPEIMVEQGTAAIGPALQLERDARAHSANAISGADPAGGVPTRDICFENVTFAYPGRPAPVLEGFDLQIDAGQSLAIVGDNGAGKTTIVKLLTRLYDPTGGAITVDGRPLASIEPTSWHRRIGAIFQDFGRYDLPVADNIGFASFGEPRDLDALERAARTGRCRGPHPRLGARLGQRVEPSVRQRRRGFRRAVATHCAGPGALRRRARRPGAHPGRAHRAARRPGRSRAVRAVPRDHPRPHRHRDLAPLLDGSPRRPHRRGRPRPRVRVRLARRAAGRGRQVRGDVPDASAEVRGMSDRGVTSNPGFRGNTRAIATAMRVGFQAAPDRMVALTVLRVLTEFSGPAQAWGLKLLTDAFVQGDRSAGLRGAALVAGALVVGDAISWMFIGFLVGLRERVGQAMDRRLIDLAMAIPGIEHYERPQYQDELQMLRDQRGDLANIPDATISNFGLLLRTITTLGLLAAIHPALIALPLFGIPAVVFGGVAERRRRRLQEKAIERARLMHSMYATATERSLGKELRVFNARAGFLARHDDLATEVRRDIVTSEAGTQALTGLGWLVFAGGFVAAVALVAVRARTGQATPGDLVLTLSLAQQINNQVTGAVSTVGFMMRTARVGHRFVWLSDYARDATAAVTPEQPVEPPVSLREGIVFDGVSFRYPGTEADVLHDVNLTIPAGATVALVGDNGAGKSTLIKLLCRFYEPTGGTMRVDGVPMADIAPAAWRSRITAGFQDYAALELPARTAVGVGNLARAEDSDAVISALERASALDVLEDLPSGLDTQLGRSFEGGVELSGGQWQKVALGRAMMREEPLVLLLDEPTSALDPQTEHALFERYAGAARRASASNGAVTVLVSHRFSTVRMADQIVVVTDGRVAECGTHDELMALGRTYAELYEMQARAYR